jgi:phosphoglycolate phosphatase
MSAPPPGRHAIVPAGGRRFAADAVVIDLDGTLLDTAPDLVAGANGMREALGMAPLPFDTVVSYVGKGADKLVHRALTADADGVAAPELFARGRAAFFDLYGRENGRRAVEYPGVRDGLEAMLAGGLRLACVTNKPGDFTLPLLQRCDLARYFELVVSGDSLPRRKPDPLPMIHVCQVFGLPAARVVAIGDSGNDVQAARAAGMAVLVVPYGYNEGRDVALLDTDGIVPTLLVAAGMIGVA